MTHFITKEFKQLSKQELYAILKLRMEIFILEQRCFYLDLDNQDQYATHILGFVKNEELACYGRITLEKSTAHIYRVCVHKNFRQTGLGSALMTQLVSYIDTLNINKIELDAQIHLQNFYAKYGFYAIGEPYDDAGIMHVPMQKVIK